MLHRDLVHKIYLPQPACRIAVIISVPVNGKPALTRVLVSQKFSTKQPVIWVECPSGDTGGVEN